MASTKDEITAIAVEHGYTGKKPKSIAQAIDALADTLAGEDVTGSRSIAGAIHALAPYIGTGGGGTERVELFNETVATEQDMFDLNAAALAYTGNITDDPLVVMFDGTEYELPKSEHKDAVDNKFVVYGPSLVDGQAPQPDFSTYPLVIMSTPVGWIVYTKDAGTHTIAAYVKPMPIPELGKLQEWPRCFSMTGSTPTVGNIIFPVFCSDLTLSVGMSAAVHCDPNQDDHMPTIASGVSIAWDPAINDKSLDDFRAAYAISVSDDMTITAMRELEGFTVGSRTISFTMPELAEGERLYIYFYARPQ